MFFSRTEIGLALTWDSVMRQFEDLSAAHEETIGYTKLGRQCQQVSVCMLCRMILPV